MSWLVLFSILHSPFFALFLPSHSRSRTRRPTPIFVPLPSALLQATGSGSSSAGTFHQEDHWNLTQKHLAHQAPCRAMLPFCVCAPSMPTRKEECYRGNHRGRKKTARQHRRLIHIWSASAWHKIPRSKHRSAQDSAFYFDGRCTNSPLYSSSSPRPVFLETRNTGL